MSGTIEDPILYNKGDAKPEPGSYVRFSNGTVAKYNEDGKFRIVKGNGRVQGSKNKKSTNKSKSKKEGFDKEDDDKNDDDDKNEDGNNGDDQEEFECVIL